MRCEIDEGLRRLVAKRNEGSAKVRIVVFEMEGSDDTIQGSLRTIAGALGRTAPPVRPALPRQQAPTPTLTEPEEAYTNYDAPEETVERVSKSPSRKGKRAYKKLDVLNIDLASGSMPLAEFCQSKKLTGNTKKYLAVAAWFHNYQNTKVIDADHVYTCYLAMHWKLPTDPNQKLR